jgi:hypothetical protein
MNTETYTEEQLQAEWKYRYEERLGILCGAETPDEDAVRIAKTEADEAIQSLSPQPGGLEHPDFEERIRRARTPCQIRSPHFKNNSA